MIDWETYCSTEDLIGFFYPDGTAKIKLHYEYFEDYTYNRSTCPEYYATGNYVFLEKSDDGKVLRILLFFKNLMFSKDY